MTLKIYLWLCAGALAELAAGQSGAPLTLTLQDALARAQTNVPQLLAAVSDALIILPLVDGSIFTIYFNKVRRKASQFSAKKLLDSNVPTFGAVLNGLNLAVSGYYYAQYYDKSYKDYYVVMSKEEEENDKPKGS